MPRLFRESPVNAIWEGSGNVQCLDVLRAMQKAPATIDAFFTELAKARGGDAVLDAFAAALADELRDPRDAEYRARRVVDRMALAMQASLLVQHAPHAVADAFCRSRLAPRGTTTSAPCRPASTARRSSIGRVPHWSEGAEGRRRESACGKWRRSSNSTPCAAPAS